MRQGARAALSRNTLGGSEGQRPLHTLTDSLPGTQQHRLGLELYVPLKEKRHFLGCRGIRQQGDHSANALGVYHPLPSTRSSWSLPGRLCHPEAGHGCWWDLSFQIMNYVFSLDAVLRVYPIGLKLH